MKHKIILSVAALAVITMVGCSDNPEPPVPTPVPTDNFCGQQNVITLYEETSSLTPREIDLLIEAPDGTEITRHASHVRNGGESTIQMETGLKEGEYRLLAAVYANPETKSQEEFPTVEYGLGSRVEVTDSGIYVIDPFNPELGYAGEGTKDSPYIVSSPSHLFNLMMTVNDYDSWRELPKGTYFRQVRNLDMRQTSKSCDMEYGWLPIGSDTNMPFRGVYLGDNHSISNLIINRPSSPGVGLFGYILDATIDGVSMENCSVRGQFAVGTLAGASISSSSSRGISTITNCSAKNCEVSGDEGSLSLGGLVGGADMYTKTLIANSSIEGGSVMGGMNVGGVIGSTGIFSSISIEGCVNTSRITSEFSGAGGIVGTADTLQIVGCRNEADITGGRKGSDGKYPAIGSGGIAGGAGMSWMTACINKGKVTGYEGVGGIVGSTRVCGSADVGYQYNQSVLRYCSNSGDIEGTRFVGGAIGEAQAGGYGVCNTGKVSGTEYIGGVCGNSSVAVIHNSVNSGAIKGDRYVSGIVGKTTWGSFALDQNYGDISGRNGITAGVVGLAGNNTVVHYCANYGTISGSDNHPMGGIVGEIGDPRKWTAMNIAECVVGSLECVMAVAGPVLAVAEHAIEMAHTVEIILKIVEISAEVCLQVSDYTLIGFSIAEMVSPEAEEELSAEMKAVTRETCTEVADMIKTIRNTAGGEVINFEASGFHGQYTPNIHSTQAWYEEEGNDEKFNERINEAREERGESNEKAAEAKEIFHTVVAGVAVLTSTVALIAGTVASGGAATAFLAVGSVAAVVGGVNAIVKSCTEFENNAVVITQCVNSGIVSSPSNSNCGPIVGKLYDGCQLNDNLNTATVRQGSLNIIYGTKGSHCEVKRNVSTFCPRSFSSGGTQLYDMVDMLVCDLNTKGDYYANGTVLYVTPKNMSDTKYYNEIGIDFTDNLWALPEGVGFALPHISQMTK